MCVGVRACMCVCIYMCKLWLEYNFKSIMIQTKQALNDHYRLLIIFETHAILILNAI